MDALLRRREMMPSSQVLDPEQNHACLAFTSTKSNTVSMTKGGTWSPKLYYSVDGQNWTQWDYSAIPFDKDHPVFFYGSNNGAKSGQNNYATFVFDGDGMVSCHGDIMTLIDGTGTTRSMPGSSNYFLRRLFYNQTKLVRPPLLPATSINQGVYYEMFMGCTNLKSAPYLPATSVSNYHYGYMFRGCTSLVNAPDLPATSVSEHGYYYMFYGCSKLERVKAMFTNTPNTTYSTTSWLSGVNSTGVFIKNVDATWTNTGVNAKPTNWEEQRYTKALPEGYTELGYIECTGNQYIDTNIFPNADLEVRSSFYATNSGVSPYGAQGYADVNKGCNYGIVVGTNAPNRMGRRSVALSITQNAWHTTIQTDSYVRVDSTPNRYSLVSPFSSPTSIYVGAYNVADAEISQHFVGRLGIQLFIRDGMEIARYVPALNNSTGVAGFYDTISKRFYTSASGTDFIAGPVPYIELEYIQSAGGARLNTGIKPNFEIHITAESNALSEYTTNAVLFGTDSSAGHWFGINKSAGVWSSNSATTSETPTARTTIVSTCTDTYMDSVINGNTYTHATTGTSVTTAVSVFLNPSNSTYPFKGKVYGHIEIYKDGSLVFNGVPMRNTRNDTVGYLDTVTNKFLTSATSTAFVAGPDKQ